MTFGLPPPLRFEMWSCGTAGHAAAHNSARQDITFTVPKVMARRPPRSPKPRRPLSGQGEPDPHEGSAGPEAVSAARRHLVAVVPLMQKGLAAPLATPCPDDCGGPFRVDTEAFRVCAEEFRADTEGLHADTEAFHVDTEEFRVCTEELRVDPEEFRVGTEELRVDLEELPLDPAGPPPPFSRREERDYRPRSPR